MDIGLSQRPSRPIQVYLVVENRLLREALVRLFRKQSDVCVAGQQQPRETTAASITASGCDVLLLDFLAAACTKNMLADLAAARSPVNVVLFGMEEDPQCFLNAIRLGISAYLFNDASSEEVISAVRRVVKGEAICPPTLCRLLFKQISEEFWRRSGMADEEACSKLGLTFRQRELIALVAKGMSNKEIASALNLSEYTVKNHVYRIMKQVEADSRQEAVDLIRAGGHFDKNSFELRPRS
jgi:DNA-binding NarL/FixJ family response regulator